MTNRPTEYDKPIGVSDLGVEPSTVRIVEGSWQPEDRVEVTDLEMQFDDDPRPSSRKLSPTANRRQEIISEGAQLANEALELFSQAVATIGIVDINARIRHGDLLKKMTSAVEEFENKI